VKIALSAKVFSFLLTKASWNCLGWATQDWQHHTWRESHQGHLPHLCSHLLRLYIM